MSCTMLLLAAVACGVGFMAMRKTKLKMRYCFTICLVTPCVLLYFNIPTCTLGIPADKNAYALHIQNVKIESRKVNLNGRELLNKDSGNRHVSVGSVAVDKIIPSEITPNVTDASPKRNFGVNAEEKNGSVMSEIVKTNVNDNLGQGIVESNIVQEKNPPIKEDFKTEVDKTELTEYEQNNDVKSPVPINSEVKVLEAPQNKMEMKDIFSEEQIADDLKKKYIVNNQKHVRLLPPINQKEYSTMKSRLPWWENIEIEKYSRIWFTGENANKTEYNKSDIFNFGFDQSKNPDHEGRFKIVVGDHIEYRYEIKKELGHGSFGTVVLARDHALLPSDTNHMVAIKIMHNDSSAERYFKQELDMMRLVLKLTRKPQLYSTVIRTFFFRNHLCFVFELLGDTLDVPYEDKTLTELNVLRKYTTDILTGLMYLHKANIIHGDLKPENIMFVPDCNISCPIYLKVSDFNLACIQNSMDYSCPGRYFQTRYYRAPEVILDLVYDVTADMWSVGVILAELYMGKVPFYGETSTDQLAAIMEVLGVLPPYMVEESPRIFTYQKAICYKCENGFERVPYRKSLTKVLKGMPKQLFDFIKRCLELDPAKRMTSIQALNHPFITQKSNFRLRPR